MFLKLEIPRTEMVCPHDCAKIELISDTIALEPSEITFFTSKEKTVQWLDYLPSPILSVCASSRICAAAMEDGAINVYSLTGRR